MYHDSHVNICHLTKEETEERLRNVQKEKSLMAKNQIAAENTEV